MTKISIERMTKIVRIIRRKGAAPKAYLLEQLEISVLAPTGN